MRIKEFMFFSIWTIYIRCYNDVVDLSNCDAEFHQEYDGGPSFLNIKLGCQKTGLESYLHIVAAPECGLPSQTQYCIAAIKCGFSKSKVTISKVEATFWGFVNNN